MKFLVLGGAGYVGSHFVAEARRQGHSCAVYDNLERGFAWAVPEECRLVQGNVLDQPLLERTLREERPDAVLHYAAWALVPESVKRPADYYRNNTLGTLSVLNAMRASAVCDSIVFSSTCAVFGTPVKVPISEDDPKNPITPYGRSKLMCEWLLQDHSQEWGLRAAALRYFNACGADADGKIGEAHEPETHLIPNILKAHRERREVTLFGTDYPTPDGTCVRDYIHVTDLAVSHLAAIKLLKSSPAGTFHAIHLGTGQGLSNLDIIRATERAVGHPIKIRHEARREGDPAALYADNRRARELLGFDPRHSSPENILRTAWAWHQR
jgi:UDP-glucose 4-epimerase